MKITFDPELHGYTIDGRPVPGIHEIGESLSLIEGSKFMPEAKKTFGQYAHEAIDFDFKGKLIRESCPKFLPYVDAARMAVTDLGIHVTETEVLVGNPGLGYATKIDAIGQTRRPLLRQHVDVRGDGMREVATAINWKTGVPMPFHALQAAAERLCLPGAGWLSVSIHLHPDNPGPDGKPYTAIWHEDSRDEEIWRDACALYDWKCRSNQSVRPRGVRPLEEEEETIPLSVKQAAAMFEPDEDSLLEKQKDVFGWDETVTEEE